MKIKNTFNVTIRKTNFNCPKGSEVLDTLSSGKDIGKITFVFGGVGGTSATTLVHACIGNANQSNVFGRVQAVVDAKTGEPYSASVLEEAARTGYRAYGARLSGTPNTIMCVFEALEPEGGDVAGAPLVTKLVEDIIARGVNTRQDIETKVAQMRKNRVPDAAIVKVLSSPGYKEYNPDAACPRTFYVDPNPDENPSIMTTCLVMCLAVKRFIAEGDKSVGKNVMTEELAWLLNLKYSIKTMSRGLTYEDIFGNMKTQMPELASMDDKEAKELAEAALLLKIQGEGAIVSLDDAARFEVLRAKAATIQLTREITDFTNWIMYGGMMCLNEVNLADPNFLASFVNQLSDGTGFIEIAGVGRVYLNEKAVLVGNRNKGYTGTQEANEATMSRFPVIKFAYPTSIKNILKSAVKHKLDDAYFSQCDKLYKAFRAAVQKNLVSNQALNIRGFVAALESVAQFPGVMTLNNALRVCVVYLVEQDEEQAALIQTLDDTVSI